MTTKISDLFIPELATGYESQEMLDKNAFIKSGVAFSDPRVTPLMDATGGGQIISMPYFNALAATEPNLGNDDPEQKSTPEKITAGYETAVKSFLNKSYSVMDLATIAAGADPMTAINNQITKYWTAVAESRVIAAATGIVADSVANHDSDLLYDISGKTGEEGLITGEAMNSAAGYLGESLTDIKIVCVHPAVFVNLQNRNFITTMQEGLTRTLFNTYGNFLIMIDKNMPKEDLGEGKYKYYTYMFGANAFSYNYGNPGVEYEIDRDPASGNGAGEELLYTRRCDLVLPRGYKTAETGKAGLSLTALKTASTWTRAWTDRERIKFVAIASVG